MNLDSTKAMRSEQSPSGHPRNALIFPDQKCDVKMGCLPKRIKKYMNPRGWVWMGIDLIILPCAFLKPPHPAPTPLPAPTTLSLVRCIHHTPWKNIFLFWILLFPSISYRHRERLSLFSSTVFASVSFFFTSSTFAAPVWLTYVKIRLSSGFLWAMYENQPTLFNTCLRGRISVHVGGAVGVGYGFRVVEEVDRQRWQLQRLH